MADYSLNAAFRADIGKNKVDKLRNQGFIPGVIYHKDKESESVQVKALEFAKVYEGAGVSALVDLMVDGDKRVVLIQDIQKHPFREDIIHVDFLEVRMDEKLKVVVPVVLLNRDEIVEQPSVLNQMLDEVEVECYPAYIPQTAEVDVRELKIGDVVTVADLDIAKMDEVEILVDLEEAVASLNPPEEVVEDEEDLEVDAADVPEIGEEDEEEDEEAAE